MASKEKDVWSSQSIHSYFEIITRDPSPKNTLANMLVSESKKLEMQIAHHQEILELMSSHEIGTLLSKDVNYLSAKKAFKPKVNGEFLPSDEIIFQMQWVFAKNQFLLNKAHATRAGASSRTREKASSAIKTLQSASKNGLALSSPLEQQQLITSLGKLQAELDATKRKRYEGKTHPMRVAIEGLAYQLCRSHGIHSPKILMYFAEFIGEQADHTTIDRYAKAGKERHKKEEQQKRRNETVTLLAASLAK